MSQGDIETATIFTRAMRKIQGKFSGVVSDISDKAAIAGQTFTGDIAAPKITASTGILFGTDTAAANTLDDYEEGAWSPVVSGGTTAGSTSAGTFSGRYTKTGDVVKAQFSLLTYTLSGAAGDLIVSGLPFGGVRMSNRTEASGSVRFFDHALPTDSLEITPTVDRTEIIFVVSKDDAPWVFVQAENSSDLTLEGTVIYTAS
jgi:hypothetical protein